MQAQAGPTFVLEPGEATRRYILALPLGGKLVASFSPQEGCTAKLLSGLASFLQGQSCKLKAASGWLQAAHCKRPNFTVGCESWMFSP